MRRLLFIIFIGLAAYTNAQVIIVDNNGNAPTGVQNDLSTAVANATAGDTILVIPSTISHGNITINKELTIIGVGFNPVMDISLTSSIAEIIIENAASGTKLIGLIIRTVQLGNSSIGFLSDIVIEKNQIGELTAINSVSFKLTNVLIRHNVFQQTSSSQKPLRLPASKKSNIIVSNNIFSKGDVSSTANGIDVIGGGVTFDHNTFLGDASQTVFDNIVNCLISNNIFINISPSSDLRAENVLYRNNLSNTAGAFSNISGTNITLRSNLEANPVFENLPLTTVTYDYSLDPRLSPGSPGEGTATDGTNIGADGGTSPFVLSGSVLPVVKQFDLPSNVLEGNNVDATIEVTGN